MSFMKVNIVLKAVYRLQRKRARNLARLLGQFIRKGDNILDLGMGNGFIAKQMQQNNDIGILGLDVKDYNITDVPLVISNSRRLPFRDSEFDIVFIIICITSC